MAVFVFGGLANVIGVAGVPGSFELLIELGVASLIVASCILAVWGFRWNLVSAGIGLELDWIKAQNPALVIGVGPGGAIIAGMIAKKLAQELRREPLVFVVDRVFKTAGRSLGVELGRTGRIDVNFPRMGGERVLVATSEVHGGNTMTLICQELDEAGLIDQYATFAFVSSPHSRFKVDRCVLVSDNRGLLPWPDSPAREGSY
jgi:hypothetical protein